MNAIRWKLPDDPEFWEWEREQAAKEAIKNGPHSCLTCVHAEHGLFCTRPVWSSRLDEWKKKRVPFLSERRNYCNPNGNYWKPREPNQ